jgi:hypothetical protein
MRGQDQPQTLIASDFHITGHLSIFTEASPTNYQGLTAFSDGSLIFKGNGIGT